MDYYYNLLGDPGLLVPVVLLFVGTKVLLVAGTIFGLFIVLLGELFGWFILFVGEVGVGAVYLSNVFCKGEGYIPWRGGCWGLVDGMFITLPSP